MAVALCLAGCTPKPTLDALERNFLEAIVSVIKTWSAVSITNGNMRGFSEKGKMTHCLHIINTT